MDTQIIIITVRNDNNLPNYLYNKIINQILNQHSLHVDELNKYHWHHAPYIIDKPTLYRIFQILAKSTHIS